MEENSFVVLKFLPINKDSDIYFDVGLRKWICTDIDDEMCGKTYWPPDSKSVTQLVKTEESFKINWPKHDVEVKRFYNSYPKARAALSGFLADSNYETEIEQDMGRGKRRKRARQISSSDSDSNMPLKTIKNSIPAPPVVTFKKAICNSQNYDVDSNLNVPSKQLKRDIPSFTLSKLIEDKKLQEKRMIVDKRKEFSLKHSRANPTELKETIQKAKDTTASKRPESLFLSKIIKRNLKPVSSSISPVSSNSNSSVKSFANYDKAIQRNMTSPSKVQSVIQSEISEDCLLNFDDPISTRTQDLILTDNINCTSSDEDTMQSNNSNSKRNDPSKLSSSYRRTLFKEQLYNKEEILSLLETKLHRTLVTVGELSGKIDILIMNMSKIMRVIIPSEKRISRPEKMPTLPLDTKQHLKEFEKFLEVDSNLASACHYMSNYMKRDAKNPERKSATNMLTKLISNTLASEMNCEGGNLKIGFKTLKLYDLFQGTLQMTFPESDLTEADAALAGWLKDAKWRKQSDGSLGNRGKKS